ncbi:hypothetical protein GCM10010327_01060 [Streptomyces nitrosporeus]|nr:hypothetical protein GCM10010327_01060 [Streptomyces nitrosporeus]
MPIARYPVLAWISSTGRPGNSAVARVPQAGDGQLSDSRWCQPCRASERRSRQQYEDRAVAEGAVQRKKRVVGGSAVGSVAAFGAVLTAGDGGRGRRWWSPGCAVFPEEPGFLVRPGFSGPLELSRGAARRAPALGKRP